MVPISLQTSGGKVVFLWVLGSGGIKGGGGMGAFPSPQFEALPPTCPPVRSKKMVKISHFWQIFGFLPPQKRILPP